MEKEQCSSAALVQFIQPIFSVLALAKAAERCRKSSMDAAAPF